MDEVIGKRVLVMCLNYFYEGKLEEVTGNFIRLSDAGIVYETGPWSADRYEDIQKTEGDHCVMTQAIESFCLSKLS
jgi:hypothetical protein